MSNRKTYFVDVLLPLAISKAYTYRVPHEANESIAIGKRVIVQFGKGNKLYAGLITGITETAPSTHLAKYFHEIIDEEPIVNQKHLKFWMWISEYYLAQLGEIMLAALPSGLRLASETKVVLHPDYAEKVKSISDEAYLLVEAMEIRQVLDLSEIAQILNVKYVHAKVKLLIDAGIVITQEEIKSRYKPKLIDYVELHPAVQQEEVLGRVFNELEKAPKQLSVLMALISQSNWGTSNERPVRKKDLMALVNASPAQIKELERKEIVCIKKVATNRLLGNYSESGLPTLSDAQKNSLKSIQNGFLSKSVCLFHGVTSAGKTEIYIHLIQEQIDLGKQVLLLLPEIALTTQIVHRLQVVFAQKLGVFHSKFNENERVEVWNRVMKANTSNSFQIIVGARSALFLPFANLGLVIVDEEHEPTFKQQDPAPRYHARDASIALAMQQGAKVLLGTATPSIESMSHAKSGKYAYVSLFKRYGEIQLPEILCIDIKRANKRREMHGNFSKDLIDAMQESIDAGKQIILFQNRRGYAPFMICETCGNSPQCINCDVSLNYHKFKNELNCHYCGYAIEKPLQCPACGDSNLQLKGFGTEQIEEELKEILPKAKVLRMDHDTTRAKKAYHQIIQSFQDREVDILVGTQMVSKGLDFDHVALVGVLNADHMLHFPDFRAYERSFQLMAQVAGRAGRKNERGKVMIQSYNPDHKIIQQVINNDYEGMMKNEIIDRRNYHYPPFYRLIQISLKHADLNLNEQGAIYLGNRLKSLFGDRILGPEAPGVARIRNLYQQNILLKLEEGISLKKSKSILLKEIQAFKSEKKYKSLRVILDVDPY